MKNQKLVFLTIMVMIAVSCSHLYVSASMYTTSIKVRLKTENPPNYKKAIEIGEEGIQVTPKDAELYYLLAECYAHVGRYKDAFNAYEMALSLDSSPKMKEKVEKGDQEYNIQGRHFYWASAYNKTTRMVQHDSLDDALNNINNAIEIAPLRAEAYNLRGLILSKMGKDEEAEKDYAETIKIDPQNPDARLTLAELLVRKQKYGEALKPLQESIKLLEEILELKPEELKARYFLTSDESFEKFKEKLNLNKQRTHYFLGVCYLQMVGKIEESQKKPTLEKAFEALKTATSLDSTDVNAWYNLGVNALQLSRPKEALLAFEKVTILDANDVEGWNYLSLIRSLPEIKDYPGAIVAIDKVIEMKPGDSELYIRKAGILSRMGGNKEEINNLLRKAQELTKPK
ncbi:MAG: tetratricopeptide repeat protein [Candidatus Edwardsbacteria bacterium]